MSRLNNVFEPNLAINDETIERVRSLLIDEAPNIACLVNKLRQHYTKVFDTDVDMVNSAQVVEAVEQLFDDYPTALNIASLVAISLALRGAEDYEVFIVDELLGSSLAETIAGGEPNRAYACASFHVLDVTMKAEVGECFDVEDELQLAVDDALAGLAAGFEAILPGWDWMKAR
jgi:phosphatidylglycerophosphatase A